MKRKNAGPIPIHQLLHFHSPDAGQLNWSFTKLPKQHPLHIPGAYCYTLYGNWGCMIFQHLPVKHFDIWLSYYDVRKPCIFYVKGDLSLIECCFEVENEKIHAVEPLHPIFCGELSYNFYYFSKVDVHVRFNGEKPITTLDIHCHPVLLDKLSQSATEKMKHFLAYVNQVKKDQHNLIHSTRIFSQPQSCTPLIRSNLNKLISALHKKRISTDLRDLVYPLLHDCLTREEIGTYTPPTENVSDIPGICKMMQANISTRFTIENLATMACMSRTSFLKAFTKQIGMSPIVYHKKLIMHEAMLLLQQSSMSIEQIAEETGYGSIAAFSRAFTKHYKYPPLNFRKNK